MRNCVLPEAAFYFFNFVNILLVVLGKAIFKFLSYVTNENIAASPQTSEVMWCLSNPILFYKAICRDCSIWLLGQNSGICSRL